MPHPARPTFDACPHGEEHDECKIRCKYNRFESGELRIDSWEVKCLDCGLRKTVAIRSDEPDEEQGAPDVCPFCDLCADGPGKELCSEK